MTFLSGPELADALKQRPELASAASDVLRELVTAAGADEATLWLLDAEGARLVAALNQGPHAQTVEGYAVSLAASLVGVVAAMGSAMAVGPDEGHNTELDQATEQALQAMVAAPVYGDDDVVGVVSAVRVAPLGGLATKSLFSAGELAAANAAAAQLESAFGERGSRPGTA